jgi:CRP-like cAMP-binding protein
MVNAEEPHIRNGILATLETPDLERLLPALEAVELERETLLYEAGGKIEQIYFPHNCVISLVAIMQDGRIAETGTLGREGYTGSEALLGSDDIATSRCLVQVSGMASRMPLTTLRRLAEERSEARRLLLAYNRALFAQVLQSVACNAMHNIEERCARWLLMTHDRAEADSFGLTQEFLAEMLGVRRASVNLVGRSFQRAGLIHYSRGCITVLDRPGLESVSCECYRTIRQVFEQFLPDPVSKN